MRNICKNTLLLVANSVWTMAFLVFVALFVASCNDDDTEVKREGWIRVLPMELNFPAAGGKQEVYLVATEDVDFAQLEYDVLESGKEWCEISLEENLLKVTVDPTYYEEPRATIIMLTYGNLDRKSVV